jgi:hypothetical protein
MVLSICFSCKNESNPNSIEKKTGISLVAFETGFEHNWLLGIRPSIKTEWENISNKVIENKININFVFIDNKTHKELSNEKGNLEYPFLPNTIKEEITEAESVDVGKDEVSGLSSKKNLVIEEIEKLDISCHIYIEGKFYKEIKIENELKSFYF